MYTKKSQNFLRKSEVTSLGVKLLALKDYQRYYGGCKSEHGYRSSSNQTAQKRNVHSVATTVVKTDRYSLSRSPSTVRMNIRSASFFGDGSDNPELLAKQEDTTIPFSDYGLDKQGEKAGQRMCDKFQVELTELKLEMQQEREDQKVYLNFLENKFEEDKDFVKAAHEEQMIDCKIGHSSYIATLQEQHKDQVDIIKEEAASNAAELRSELDDLMKAAHAKLMQEKENVKNKTQEIEKLKENHKEQIAKMKEVIEKHSPTNDQLIGEEMTADHRHEKDRLFQSHKNEIENMFSQITIAKEFEKDAHKTRKLLKKQEKMNLRLKNELKSSEAKQIKIEVELLHAETALANFEKMFEQKVKDAEAKLTDRLDDLVLQNAQLRRKLFTKVEEFCQYRVNVELANSRTVQSFREKNPTVSTNQTADVLEDQLQLPLDLVQVMLKARAKAKLGIALGTFLEDSTSHLPVPAQRPSSAPSTLRVRTGSLLHPVIRSYFGTETST